MNKTGIIYGVNGPVIYLKGDPGFKLSLIHISEPTRH